MSIKVFNQSGNLVGRIRKHGVLWVIRHNGYVDYSDTLDEAVEYLHEHYA